MKSFKQVRGSVVEGKIEDDPEDGIDPKDGFNELGGLPHVRLLCDVDGVGPVRSAAPWPVIHARLSKAISS